ncbi:MAG: STAS domain-containing protein [Methylococcaceae bacterium]
MKISCEELNGDIYKINLTGRMDIPGNAEIDIKFSGMTASPGKLFIIDLSGVDFIASIGIRTILMSAKAIQNRGGKIVLLNPTDHVSKILSVAGIGTILDITNNLESALCLLLPEK